MEVNDYRYQELNLASKAIIEKLQHLAIEKAKLEEAIRLQKIKEEGESVKQREFMIRHNMMDVPTITAKEEKVVLQNSHTINQ